MEYSVWSLGPCPCIAKLTRAFARTPDHGPFDDLHCDSLNAVHGILLNRFAYLERDPELWTQLYMNHVRAAPAFTATELATRVRSFVAALRSRRHTPALVYLVRRGEDLGFAMQAARGIMYSLHTALPLALHWPGSLEHQETREREFVILLLAESDAPINQQWTRVFEDNERAVKVRLRIETRAVCTSHECGDESETDMHEWSVCASSALALRPTAVCGR